MDGATPPPGPPPADPPVVPGSGEGPLFSPGPVPRGLDHLIGTEIIEAGPRRVHLRLALGPQHLQPFGVVHGGVHATLAETAASIAACLNAKRAAVGIANHTSFLRAVRDGVLDAVATPLHTGRAVQLWEVAIRQDTALVATARVQLYVLPSGGLRGSARAR
ncbi:MAG TPA: PaaI family thioesterase [Candidatus Micrarchaeia archaeon]|nr:PaaI family thioesterase [Candidatus Micrarchaeia archaeon]